MNKVYNWGIIGLGSIAKKFAEGLAVLPNAKLYAVASRSLEKAKKFAASYNAPVAYGSYEEIAADKNVDIIYIATPHTLHYENTMMSLRNKVAVLCEKPFAINRKEVVNMIATAKENKVFLMEAMWTAFLPSIIKIKEVIASGLIGEVQTIRADFGIKPPYDPTSRIYNLSLGGGSLLDIGIYPAFLALEILGKPDEIKALASIGKTGVDENCGFVFRYKNGPIASLFSTILADTSTDAMITGTDGIIHIHSKFFMPVGFTVISSEDKATEIAPEYAGNGYNYEAAEVMACLDRGAMESNIMSHEKSLQLIEILDKIRNECGIQYPEHDEN